MGDRLAVIWAKLGQADPQGGGGRVGGWGGQTSPPPALPKIVSGGREAPGICSTPYISLLIVAAAPTIATRRRLPFASASLDPGRSATSRNVKSGWGGGY